MPRGRPRSSPMADDKPHGRMTAYAFFVQTCRAEHKKNHPDENVNFVEFSRQCSERWKTMSDQEKKKFHELADKDKMRYDIEMKDYIPPLGVGGGRRGRRGRGRGRKERDPNKPKRALSAFFYYANEERARVRAANPDFSVGEVAKELGRQWNEMAEDRKVKFERLAEEDRARYDREMTAYRSGCSPMKRIDLSPYEDPMGRAKRARSALFYFANEERPRVQAANPDFTDSEVAKELGRMWNELSEDRMMAYERLAQADSLGQNYNNMMTYGAAASPIKKTVATAFSLFALQERNKVVAMNPGFTEKEVSEELERLWDELDEEVMARYERLAELPNASGFSPLKSRQPASNGHTPIVLDDDDDEEEIGSDED